MEEPEPGSEGVQVTVLGFRAHPATMVSRVVFVLMIWVGAVRAQEMPAGLTRTAGAEADSGIAYTLISVQGKGPGGVAPRLIAQCSKTAAGKLRFELMADEPGSEGGGTLVFQAPWRAGKGENFAPPLRKVQVTMEFLGYVKEKPVKRQWEYPFGTVGLMRYSTPGMRSGNMEDVAYYLRYMRSLPTLRLTVGGGGTVEFETGKWLGVVKAEAMCAASGL